MLKQLKRLELKLKQFAEVETLLMKECEQVEKTRQRLAGERARALATRYGPSGTGAGAGAAPMGLPGVAPQANNNVSISRPPIVSPSASQHNVSGYSNSQVNHPQMSFLQRQQMFSFGPRLPLSAIQPSSPGLPANVMFGAQGSDQSSPSHPLLRPVPGTSSGMG